MSNSLVDFEWEDRIRELEYEHAENPDQSVEATYSSDGHQPHANVQMYAGEYRSDTDTVSNPATVTSDPFFSPPNPPESSRWGSSVPLQGGSLYPVDTQTTAQTSSYESAEQSAADHTVDPKTLSRGSRGPKTGRKKVAYVDYTPKQLKHRERKRKERRRDADADLRILNETHHVKRYHTINIALISPSDSSSMLAFMEGLPTTGETWVIDRRDKSASNTGYKPKEGATYVLTNTPGMVQYAVGLFQKANVTVLTKEEKAEANVHREKQRDVTL